MLASVFSFEPCCGVTAKKCCWEFFVELVVVFNGIGEQSGVTGFVCRYRWFSRVCCWLGLDERCSG